MADNSMLKHITLHHKMFVILKMQQHIITLKHNLEQGRLKNMVPFYG